MKAMELILGRRLRTLRIVSIISGALLVIGVLLPYGLANLILTTVGLIVLLAALLRYGKVKWRGLFTLGAYRGDIAEELDNGCKVVPPGYYFLKEALLDGIMIQTAHYSDIIKIVVRSDSETFPEEKRRYRMIITGPTGSIVLKKFGSREMSAEDSFREVCSILKSKSENAQYIEE
ncbi:MAG: hypothetical protein IKO44_02995 [Ruminococcus sp.]|nr:hypothetical protein [Ruminococcus sp.]